MKFDHTFIAIRQRTWLEIYDLSLHVLRDYFSPIMILLLVGALPWILLDWCLLGWMLSDEYCDGYSVSLLGLIANEEGYDSHAVGFGWLTLLLIINQAQVGTAMISHYLGQSMFIGKPKIGESIRCLWTVPFSFYWLHYGLRGVLPAGLLVGAIGLSRDSSERSDMTGTAVFFLVIVVLVGLLVRAFRPYVTKIVVLEKATWKATEDNPISFTNRSNSLHGSDGWFLFLQLFVSAIFGFMLTMGVYGTLMMIYSALDITWSTGFVELAVIWPMSLWLTAAFFAIVRFLTYIDLRIRQEGWEVELRIRAEALKMEQGA